MSKENVKLSTEIVSAREIRDRHTGFESTMRVWCTETRWEMYNADVIVQCSQIEKINLAKWEGIMFRYQFAVFY